MSAILDKSLDEIVSANKKNNNQNNNNNRRRTRRSTGPATTSKAPAGGIQKNSKPAKQTQQKPQAKPQQQQQQQQKAAPKNSDSKVIVSNLPKDVSEQQIKEYFNQTVGPIKKVIIAYGPNSQSRGIAEVIFSRADSAAKAAALNGLLVDGRPIKIEIVVSYSQAAQVLPTPKSLADRAILPKNLKNQPKSAANDRKQDKKAKDAKTNQNSNNNNQTNGNKTAANGRNNRRRSRTVRPKKTEAELDSEMADYYSQAPTAPAAAASAPATVPAAAATNDTAMDDTIM